MTHLSALNVFKDDNNLPYSVCGMFLCLKFTARPVRYLITSSMSFKVKSVFDVVLDERFKRKFIRVVMIVTLALTKAFSKICINHF